jgi:hypothetical protein
VAALVTIRVLTIVLAALAFGCGLRAARLWYRSSLVKPEPEGFEPVDDYLRNMWWQSAQLEAADQSAALNGRAAKWTAWAVALSAASAIAGALI